ncbi:heavy-metal-associated domain-containing protein [Lysobacter cavernae]|uniref:Heavy-metal-associated domain-containing protein n=1 Tax=Lysobacter cavernae TaxID=1685901 RepID=A0ABV7RLB1_9GAMM
MLTALLIGVSGFASAKTIEMSVNGLVCAFCAQGIEKTLKAFAATEAVFVSLENRIVAVKLKDGSDIGDDVLRKAIKDAGYTVVSIRRTEHSLDQIRQQVKHEN